MASNNSAVSSHTRFDRFEMVPFATQRAPSCRATATAQSLPQGLPPASAPATAAATAVESTHVTRTDARSVANILLVAPATYGVAPGPGTFTCTPSHHTMTLS